MTSSPYGPYKLGYKRVTMIITMSYTINGSLIVPITSDIGMASFNLLTGSSWIIIATNAVGSVASASFILTAPSIITSISTSSITSTGFIASWSGGISSYPTTTTTYTINGSSVTPISSGTGTATFGSLSGLIWILIITATNAIGSVISSSTTVNATVTFDASTLNLQNWYNPDNVTLTSSGYVTSWIDSIANYNLSNVISGGTGNTMTRVTVSGTTANVIYQSNIGSPMTNWSYLCGGTFTETIYVVMFCCNTIAVNGGFDEIFGDKNNLGSIRFTTSTTSLNNGDLNQNGSTYVNGTLVQSGNTVTLPSTVPTGFKIYCIYVTGSMRTAITTLSLLGDYATVARGFTGYAGDFFIGNSSFGTTQQQQLEGYLGYKYKCQSGLPTNHPYYSATNSNIIKLIVIPKTNVDTITYGGITVSAVAGSLGTGNGIVSGAASTYNVYAFGSTAGQYVINYTCNIASNIYVLAVGGGGGSAHDVGGGGGGGGVASIAVPVTSGSGTITITVGSGGINSIGATGGSGNNSTVQFAGISTILVTVTGGGGGGGNGANGGGANGGVGGASGIPSSVGSSTSNAGGTNLGSVNYSGGGGGAGAVGANGTGGPHGNGGAGLQCTTTLFGVKDFTLAGAPVSSWYWGGGGSSSNPTVNSAGIGGGGAGSASWNSNNINGGLGINNGGSCVGAAGGNGGSNTGGGGGGGGFNAGAAGGNGGSGIVIIAFPQ